jgi:hypothetical protein
MGTLSSTLGQLVFWASSTALRCTGAQTALDLDSTNFQSRYPVSGSNGLTYRQYGQAQKKGPTVQILTWVRRRQTVDAGEISSVQTDAPERPQVLRWRSFGPARVGRRVVHTAHARRA